MNKFKDTFFEKKEANLAVLFEEKSKEYKIKMMKSIITEKMFGIVPELLKEHREDKR